MKIGIWSQAGIDFLDFSISRKENELFDLRIVDPSIIKGPLIVLIDFESIGHGTKEVYSALSKLWAVQNTIAVLLSISWVSLAKRGNEVTQFKGAFDDILIGPLKASELDTRLRICWKGVVSSRKTE
jgi:hypothetical protein